jgi:hypothetical protein
MDVKDFLRVEFNNFRRRYKGLVFTSNSSNELSSIRQSLLQALSPIDEWIKPGEYHAPLMPISRMDFCEQVFRKNHPDGLLIFLPEEWMFDWTDDDKRVFWRELSQTFGQNKIYVVSNGTTSNIQLINKNFVSTHLEKSNITAWTSKYE